MTTPTPTPTDREALAKIIDEEAFYNLGKPSGLTKDFEYARQQSALRKADAILALFPQAAREQALEEAAQRVDVIRKHCYEMDVRTGLEIAARDIRSLKSTPSPVERQEDVVERDGFYAWVVEDGRSPTDAPRYLQRIDNHGPHSVEANWTTNWRTAWKFADRQSAQSACDNIYETMIDYWHRVAEHHFPLAAASLLRTPQAETQGGDAVAWRCKDFGDNWILYANEADARQYEKDSGCLMQALYLSPVSERERDALTEHDLYYLKSVKRQLDEYKNLINTSEVFQPSIGTEVLADNLDWLDCFIDAKERALKSPATTSALDGWMPEPYPLEIRYKNEAIDEIVASPVHHLHIEQMSNDGWYMGFDTADGTHHQFWFGSKNRKTHVEFRHTESSPLRDLDPAPTGRDG